MYAVRLVVTMLALPLSLLPTLSTPHLFRSNLVLNHLAVLG
jgi:hypothetical protein